MKSKNQNVSLEAMEVILQELQGRSFNGTSQEAVNEKNVTQYVSNWAADILNKTLNLSKILNSTDWMFELSRLLKILNCIQNCSTTVLQDIQEVNEVIQLTKLIDFQVNYTFKLLSSGQIGKQIFCVIQL